MRGRLLESTPASFITVVMMGACFVLFRVANIISWLDTFGAAVTLAGYIIGFLCLVIALVFGAFYARSLKIIGAGIIANLILYLLLHKLDPASVAFWIEADQYKAKVENTVGREPKFVVFKLKEGLGFPAGGVWDYIVFDATDEIGFAAAQRTEEWRKLHGGYVTPATSQCEVRIRHLDGHFFICSNVVRQYGSQP